MIMPHQMYLLLPLPFFHNTSGSRNLQGITKFLIEQNACVEFEFRAVQLQTRLLMNLFCSSAYSEDALQLSYHSVATNLGVDKFNCNQNCSDQLRQLPRSKQSTHKLYILHLVLERPGIYLHEIQRSPKHHCECRNNL